MIEVIATGDGVTDDTAAMQAALDQGGHVYVPGGTYRIAGTPLRIRERTRLELAPDATILRASGPGLIRNRWDSDDFGGYTGRGGILVEGGAWDMAGATVAGPASAMGFAHADDVVVRDTRIVDVPGAHGVDLMGCQGVRVEGVTFAGYLADPGDGQARESIQIDGAFGTYSGDCAPFDSTPCRDVLIRACRFGPSAGLPAPQRAVGSHGYLADVQGHEHSGIRVADCWMDVTDVGVVAWCWEESAITGNVVRSPGQNGIAVRDRAWHVDVAHNQIYDSGTSGVYVTGGAVNNVVVHGNTIVGSSRAAHNTHHGICVQGGVQSINLVGNRVRMRGSGPNAKYGLYISGSCSGVLRDGNDLRSSGVTASRRDDSASPVFLAADALS